MKRHLFDLTVLFLIASAIAAYVAFAEPSFRSVTLRVYIFVLGGLLMLALVAGGAESRQRRGSSFERALDEPAPKERTVSELEKLEREVTLATGAAFDLHFRLLPQLREIAQARLERSGHAPGPDTLGPWWELLRPDRPPPDDRFARGISNAELRALVADLERM